MSPPSPHLPIFNFDFTTATSHKPAHSSPLSSSPIRASQTSPPLSPRDPNTLPRRGFFSSPINPAACNQEKSKWTRFETRDVKKNPLKQSRDNAVEGKRKLFLKNVRQRRDDQAWERRGGDQEILRLEWSNQDRKRRQQKERDAEGFLFEEDLEDIPDFLQSYSSTVEQDDMMVDSHVMDEEAELEAMLSAYEAGNTEPKSHQMPDSPSISDDEYDSIFMDMLSQDGSHRQQGQEDLAMSGQMDMS
ncbi:hypothetical protein G7054_g6775 [Neopestalotiopsis clavispora]|nr:hypothetical protein G7054_g6775 [Neopestalotiopsis clavispora]